MRAALSTTLLLLGCGASVQPMARVAHFGPWDQPRGTLCSNGRPLGVELRRPPVCAPGEEAWEQRFPSGVLRECRLADRVTARHAIGLSTTGCIEALERWQSTDGRVVSDAVRSWARWTEHLELELACPQAGPCLVGDYRVSLAGGPTLSGRFDDAGRVHGRWVLEQPETRREVEFVHGAGQLRDVGPIVKADCVDGLVDGELVLRRPLSDGRVVELRVTLDRGLRHGPFRLGLVEGRALMEGRYEQGTPVGPWTLPTSTCVEQHMGSQCGFLQCIRWSAGTTPAVCEGTCRATPTTSRDEPRPAGLEAGEQLATTPRLRLSPLSCHEVLTALVPAPGQVADRFTAHRPTDAWAELGSVSVP